jgi:hypothetical protein
VKKIFRKINITFTPKHSIPNGLGTGSSNGGAFLKNDEFTHRPMPMQGNFILSDRTDVNNR